MFVANHFRNLALCLRDGCFLAFTESVIGRERVLTLRKGLVWAVALMLPAFVVEAGVTFTSLYSFTGGNDGYSPNGLVQGLDSYFYGTTFNGGTNSDGTVFKISTSGALTSLYSFSGGSDGSNPQAGLVQGSDGYFYGTTQSGGKPALGQPAGTVFKVSSDGALTNLYSFNVDSPGGNDGSYPVAGLVQRNDGLFYGTTLEGGTYAFSGNGTNGYGTVFRISTNGALTRLYAFSGGDDGANPAAGLLPAADVYFYSTTQSGGLSNSGTVFKIDPGGGTLTNLYSFTGGDDGGGPVGGLVQSADGYFYGTTYGGGTNNFGSVFKISTNGELTSLYSFSGVNDGANPQAALVQGSDGNFYGTTVNGGQGGAGTVFRLAGELGPPQLTIILSKASVIVSWSTNASGFILYSTTNLASSVWTRNSLAPVVVNGQNTVTNPISGSQQFFRLSQ